MTCILQSKFDEVVGRIVQAIKSRGNPGHGGVVVFSIAIDATKVSNGLETLYRYKELIGRPYLDHFVSIEGLYSEEIEAFLKGDKLSSEAKTAVISVHNAAALLSPVDVVAVRPQTNNDTRSFTKLVELAAAASANHNYGVRFLNWAVDGVYLESNYVWRAICNFLSAVADNVSGNDINHNIKLWRYQIIGGSCVPLIGSNVVDSDLLCISGVSIDLLRYSNFDLYLLVTKLAYSHTVEKTSALVDAR